MRCRTDTGSSDANSLIRYICMGISTRLTGSILPDQKMRGGLPYSIIAGCVAEHDPKSTNENAPAVDYDSTRFGTGRRSYALSLTAPRDQMDKFT